MQTIKFHKQISKLKTFMTKKKAIVLPAAIACVMCISFCFYANVIKQEPLQLSSSETGEVGASQEVVTSLKDTIDDSVNSVVSSKDETEDALCVYVCGAVNQPGVYYFQKEETIEDAINRAGGALNEAACDRINLALLLQDRQKVYVPYKSDSGAVLTDGSNPQVESNALININSASSIELQALNGVGESLSKQIIAYREKNGSFKTVEELKNVTGIGEKKFEQIKDYVCL